MSIYICSNSYQDPIRIFLARSNSVKIRDTFLQTEVKECNRATGDGKVTREEVTEINRSNSKNRAIMLINDTLGESVLQTAVMS